MKKIAIYTRKSRMTDTGDSIGTQIKLVKDYFRNQECEFEIFEDEGFSGGNTNRPAFQLMIEKVKSKKFDIVAVYKIDRIARNIIDFFKIFDTFEKENVSLVSISEGFDPNTPGGRVTMTMIAGMAEMERMNIKQRVKDNMIELAKKGKWTGGTLPLGYNSIRVFEAGKECSYLTINENEVTIVKDIFNWFIEGYSTRKISKMVNDKYSIYTSPTRISNVLYSPIYVKSCDIINKYLELNNYLVCGSINGKGYLTYQRTTTKTGTKRIDRDNKTIVAPSKHEAIIDEKTWIKVQERLKQIAVDPKPRISQYTFLAQMVKCGYCGSPMNVYRENRKNGSYVRFFKKTCKCNHTGKIRNGSRLTIEKAENYTLELLKTVQISGIESLIEKTSKNEYVNDRVNIKKIEREIKKLDELINGLTDKLAIAPINLIETLMNRIDMLINNKKNLQEQILILEQRNNFNITKKENINLLNNNIHHFLLNFDNLTNEQRQIEIKKIFEYVTWKGIEREFNVKIIEV